MASTSTWTPTPVGGPLPGTCALTNNSTYSYDGLDRQRSHADTLNTTVTTVGLHYDGLTNTVVNETSTSATSGDSYYTLDPSGTHQALLPGTAGAGAQYLADDGNGNNTTVTDANGSILCTARFDPYGNPEGSTAADVPNKVCNTGTSANDAYYRDARKDATANTYQF